MNETQVITNTRGTIINMDPIAAKNLLVNLAITTIIQCKEIIIKENSGVLEFKTQVPLYDNLVSHYCPGNHGAVLSNMLYQNVNVLYRFVEDCVTNGTVNGLYLLCEQSKYGEPTWKLILDALDVYMDFVQRQYDTLERKIPADYPRFNKYNEQFEELINYKCNIGV